jgi:hypothetical protein
VGELEASRRPAEESRTLLDDPTLRVEAVPGRVYVAWISGHFSLETMATVLDAAWGDPKWKQPWGLVLHIAEGVTYDTDLRHHAMPPPNRRAVGTAIVSAKQVHRMVVSSIGIGMRLAHGFHLSAHAEVEAGIAAQRQVVRTVEATGRDY